MDAVFYMQGRDSNVKLTLPENCNNDFYMVRVVPLISGYSGNAFMPHPYFKVKNNNGVLSFNYNFKFECQYTISINEENSDDIEMDYYCLGNSIKEYYVYSLPEELFNLNIYRLDFHCHSTASDGSFDPEIVCAYYREKGYDALAITDHYTMKGSFLAKEFYKDIDMDMKLYYGEETQPTAVDPHIVCWGCNKSVSSEIYKNEQTHQFSDSYNKALDEIIEKYNLSKYRNPRCIANCIWRCNKIRENGGISILAHPAWNILIDFTEAEIWDYMFENKIPDAFELVGGNTIKDNNHQVNYYMQYLREGNDLPIVADSDSHGDSGYFNTKYTYLLSKSSDKNDIINAVKSRRSIPCDRGNSPDGELRIYADYNLSRLGHFIDEVFFPQLMSQYEKEGKLMMDIAKGDKSKIKELEKEKGKIPFLKRSLYCEY